MTALASCAFAVADLVVGNVERLRQYVRSGLFDALLVRPLGSLAQLVAMDVATRRVGRVAFGVVMLVLAAANAPVEFDAGAAGAAGGDADRRRRDLRGRLRGHGHRGVLVDRVRRDRQRADLRRTHDFTQYPITIYGALFRRLFAYGVGFAFVAYYPGAGAARPPRPARRAGVPRLCRAGHRGRGGRRRRDSCGGPAFGTIGAPARDRHRGARASQGVHRARESGMAAPPHARGRRRRRHRSHRGARGDARLHRPERRRQVDDPEDAHRRALPVRGAGEGLRPRAGAPAHAAGAADRRRLRPALPALVGPAAAATRSRCCATSTRCRPRSTPPGWPTAGGCSISTRSSTSRCGSSRSASGCAAS